VYKQAAQRKSRNTAYKAAPGRHTLQGCTSFGTTTSAGKRRPLSVFAKMVQDRTSAKTLKFSIIKLVPHIFLTNRPAQTHAPSVTPIEGVNLKPSNARQ